MAGSQGAKGQVKRSAPLTRGTPVRRANPKRKAAAFARAYGSQARVAWVQGLPSVVSGAGPCENAHVKTGGMGLKASAIWIVPLTSAEHAELHAVGMRTFEARHNVNLFREAQRVALAWEQHNGSEA